MAKTNPNATISYFEISGSTSRSFVLWVDTVSQANGLSGTSAQSRLTRHFYPHAHTIGNFAIEGTCSSQDDYQNLAQFIRGHQVAMLDQPVDESFTRVAGAGYRRLMTLSVPSESLWIRGFIPRITLNKKGVFEPAPKFNFDFVVIFDSHSTNIYLSNAIRKYFSGAFDTTAIKDQPTAESTPIITPPPGGFKKPLI